MHSSSESYMLHSTPVYRGIACRLTRDIILTYSLTNSIKDNIYFMTFRALSDDTFQSHYINVSWDFSTVMQSVSQLRCAGSIQYSALYYYVVRALIQYILRVLIYRVKNGRHGDRSSIVNAPAAREYKRLYTASSKVKIYDEYSGSR